VAVNKVVVVPVITSSTEAVAKNIHKKTKYLQLNGNTSI
jgi:hypothetical protein